MTVNLKFRLWLIICASVGLFLTTHQWNQSSVLLGLPFLGHVLIAILPSIGEALVIAMVTAFVVDAVAKRQLLTEFARDVSIHIVGRLLPEHLREHMLRYLNSGIVRKNWNLTFTISEWPNRSEFVQLNTRSEYEIENCEDVARKYDFFYEVEKSWFPEVGEGRLLHVCISKGGTKIFDEDELALKAKLTAEPDCLLFQETISIPSGPHPTYRFLTETIECFRDGFSPFVAPVAVLGTTVIVYYPKDKFRVAMYVSTRPSEHTLEVTQLTNGTQWRIIEPLLPGQCIFTRWERLTGREVSTATSA